MSTSIAKAFVSLRNNKSQVALLTEFRLLKVSTTRCSRIEICDGVTLLESPIKLMTRKDSNSSFLLHAPDSDFRTTTKSTLSTNKTAKEDCTNELNLDGKPDGGKHV